MLNISEQEQIALLLQKYIFSQAEGERLSTADQETLDQWRQASDENENLFQSLMNRKQLRADLNKLSYIESRVESRWDKLSEQLTEERPVRKIRTYLVISVGVAACLLGAFMVLFLRPQHKSPLYQAYVHSNSHFQAILAYADGKKVDMDSVKTGSVLRDEGTVIKKIDSTTLQYISGSAGLRHTLTTPNGGRYRVILLDGSSIYLNTSSTVTYPTAFGEGKRVVDLEGEAFFHVAHRGGSTFAVHTDKQDVEDLATRFDVKNYRNEPGVYTTLVEGSVKVSAGNNRKILEPGEQAASLANGTFSVSRVDTFATTGWTSGRLIFTHLPLTAVMNQLSRWYGVEVVYKDSVDIGDPIFGYSTVNSTSALPDVLSHINNVLNLHCSYDEAAKAIVVNR